MMTNHFSDSKLTLNANREWTNQIDSQKHVNYVRAQMVSPRLNSDNNWKRDRNICNSNSFELDYKE